MLNYILGCFTGAIIMICVMALVSVSSRDEDNEKE